MGTFRPLPIVCIMEVSVFSYILINRFDCNEFFDDTTDKLYKYLKVQLLLAEHAPIEMVLEGSYQLLELRRIVSLYCGFRVQVIITGSLNLHPFNLNRNANWSFPSNQNIFCLCYYNIIHLCPTLESDLIPIDGGAGQWVRGPTSNQLNIQLKTKKGCNHLI